MKKLSKKQIIGLSIAVIVLVIIYLMGRGSLDGFLSKLSKGSAKISGGPAGGGGGGGALKGSEVKSDLSISDKRVIVSSSGGLVGFLPGVVPNRAGSNAEPGARWTQGQTVGFATGKYIVRSDGAVFIEVSANPPLRVVGKFYVSKARVSFSNQ